MKNTALIDAANLQPGTYHTNVWLCIRASRILATQW